MATRLGPVERLVYILRMSLLKPILAGVLGAVLAAVVYMAGLVLYEMWQQGALAAEGSGGFGLVVSVIPVFGVALAGFVLGFTWMRRRSRRRLRPPN
jgi:hypothetical protein